MKFNEKLLELRKKEGLSQEELADKVDVSRQTVSKWEAGQTTPEMEKLLELSKLFNISLDELTGNEVEKKDNNEEAKPTKKKHKVLKVLLIILAIYLVISLVKFILLTRHALIVDSFDEENYSIAISITNTNPNEDPPQGHIYEFITKKGNLYQEITQYEIGEDVDPYRITYVDSDNRKAVELIWEEENGKYSVSNAESRNASDNLDDFYNLHSSSDILKGYTNIPLDLKERIQYSLNPFVFYNPFSRTMIINIPFSIYIEYKYNNDYLSTYTYVINKKYGTKSLWTIGYDYVQDHFDDIEIIDPLVEYKDKLLYNRYDLNN